LEHGRMIAKHFTNCVEHNPNRVALADGAESTTFRELHTLVLNVVEQLSSLAGKRVGYSGDGALFHLATFIAADWLGIHLFLGGNRSDAEMQRLSKEMMWDDTLTERKLRKGKHRSTSDFASLPEIGNGVVTVLTSGTTDTPKPANHTWQTLSSPVRISDKFRDAVWFSAYPVHLYAGIQVLLQGFLNKNTVVCGGSREAAQVVRSMQQVGVTHASGTPTFWRQLLMFGSHVALQELSLQQITMGGEIATQELLTKLSNAFPQCRIAHIYASTELGRVFVVQDGREGFPIEYLANVPETGNALRISDGELYVRSRHRMVGYDNKSMDQTDSWVATGDLVEVADDRVRFLGRKVEIINVGGHKVAPVQVENKLRQTRGIVDLRVFGRKSSLVGQVVALEVVASDDVDESEVREQLKGQINSSLQPYERPATVRFVREIVNNEAQKTIRKAV